MAQNIMKRPCITLTLLVLVLQLLCGVVYGRFFSDVGSDILVSDGFDKQSSFIRLFGSAGEECENTYGFMPCTTTALGNCFLIVVYGYLMYLAATFLSSGSELLLESLGPGLIGGLLLPILGALPDAMLILVSGLSGSIETAQSQVSVGIGLLAGSTVMLLTLIWGSCVIVGKCDIVNSVALDNKDTKLFSLTSSGVSTDIWTSYAAIIMAVSVIPFIVVQFPQIIHSTSGRHSAVLIALIVSVALLISYCLYQVFQPWVQKRRLAYSKHKHVISGILKHLKMHSLGKFCDNDGNPNEKVLRRLFDTIDENGDGHLSHTELRALVLGISLDDINLNEEDTVGKVLKDFDTSLDAKVSFEEFVNGIGRWIEEAKGSKPHSKGEDDDTGTFKYLNDFHEQTKRDHHLLGDQSDENVENVENGEWTRTKAVLLLLLGTVIAGVFADPLVDAVHNFSSATNIPSFFISFIVLPLATNSSEAVSAIIFSTRKNLRSASLTFSELYGAATMNNVLCLSVFLGLVYIRGLTWDFSAEVLVIMIVCLVMGIFGSVRTTFPIWTSLIAFMLYPFSLALVYVLDYLFGWT